ncbi:hypothetical protein COB57_05320 [Candidatus Peregrinibacteria bacterium]|nr:MAG: hypothetical protein COB57_05320 [Candidatus Peregrinibacteria bacterium]
MNLEILESIGLSQNEAKIYEVLLDLGESGVSTIAVKANVHRRNVYDTLNRLIEKGLVFQIFQKSENLYSPVDPGKLMELLKEKETKLKKIMPHLETLYHSQPVEEAAFIYKGLEGYKNYLRDLARIGETTYFLGAKALWFTPGIQKAFLKNYQREMKKKKQTYYTLFDYRVYEMMPKAMNMVGGEYKVLPKEYSTPGICDICGDYIFTFNSANVGDFGEDGSIFVMKNKQLADSYRTWFQFIWDFCPELPNIKKTP